MAAGLPALAAHLQAAGHPARVWNLAAERSAGIRRDLARDLKPVRLLGISVHWFYQLPPALALARRARSIGYDGFIVLGGFTASLMARELVERHAEIDGVVRGDAETLLPALAHQLSLSRRRLVRVPNLVWRSRGQVRSNAFSYVGREAQIDALDFGRLDTIDHLDAHFASSSWRAITDGSPGASMDLSRTFYLCGGRGCSVACTTCGGGRLAHRAHSRRRRVAFRSPARIADDVQDAVRLGATSIHACFDPVPNGPHWHAFMDEVESRGIRLPMIFESFGLPDGRFLERFAEVFSGGIVVISPETADESVRSRIRGFPFTNADLEQRLALIGSLGLRAQVFLGYFAPLEGLAGLHRSRRWARDLLRRHGEYMELMHYPYSTDPGSPLARRPSTFGMRCSVRTAADYERELELQDPWLGNLLRHSPDTGTTDDWRAAGLGVELEQACLRHEPGMHSVLEKTLGRKIDVFFLGLARRLLAQRDPGTLDRNGLADILRHEALKDMGAPR
ncbi:MAG: cobalamin-dependent protein [Deltaproteobacteria bacterium]|nr:cobalamin-dependent protein [Deltaproteobacteria bacterium]